MGSKKIKISVNFDQIFLLRSIKLLNKNHENLQKFLFLDKYCIYKDWNQIKIARNLTSLLFRIKPILRELFVPALSEVR